jgi:hypothetical protein
MLPMSIVFQYQIDKRNIAMPDKIRQQYMNNN